MKKYKLTTQKMTTHNGCKWKLGVAKETNGIGELCGPGWLHYYHHPLLAVLLNPIHSRFEKPRLYEVKAGGKHLDDHRLKGGCTKMTLTKRIKIPKITINQKTAFGIYCAIEVYKEESFMKWAKDWLNNRNRDINAAHSAAHSAANNAYSAAHSAANSAYNAAYSAAYSAANSAFSAAHSAANNAYSAAHSAAYSAAHSATNSAYSAAHSAANSAYSAAYSTAYSAIIDNKKISLIKLAKKAMKIK